MTAEEVIRLGQEAQLKTEFMWSEVSWWAWLLAIPMWAIAVFFLLYGLYLLFSGDWELTFPGILFSLMLGAIGSLGMHTGEVVVQEDRVGEWKNEVAIPYIESLPVEKREIVYIKIDTELSHEVSGQHFLYYGYTRSSEVQRTPLIISYKGNGITTETDWYEAHMELTSEELPYIEF